MRNQLKAGLFCCLAAQATAFAIWANYTAAHQNPFGYFSVLLMWFSCYTMCVTLGKKEYRTVYQATWNPWAIAGHPEAVVRFGYGVLAKPKLMVGGGCVAWFSKYHQTMHMLVVSPRFFLFTHHLLQDSRITAQLFECHRNDTPTWRQRWYSWLLRAEYVEYTYNGYIQQDFVTIRDIHRETYWEDREASNYYQRVASALVDHWSVRTFLGYTVDIPEALQRP